MNNGRIIFSQLMDSFPMHEFNRCVRRYRGNHKVRKFSCLDQLLCLFFAQLTYRDSLRDIVTCLRSLQPKLYHAGLRGKISRSTLADANERRDWRIVADMTAVLIKRARELYAGDGFAVELDQACYAFDSTTIDLCMALFPWAKFRQKKSAVKLHTLIDLCGNIPCFIHISDGKMVDMASMDLLPIEPGSFYVMDRGYTDFERLHRFTTHAAFFITRAKKDLDFIRVTHHTVDKSTGLRSDNTIRLAGPKTSRRYPDTLRRITYVDPDTGKRFVFLTNNFTLPALTIAQLYKCRWQVELFFKWIKGHLRIKTFFGHSENAVKTQVWTAVAVYVLVAIVKKEWKIERSMGEILQILSLSLFEKKPMLQAFLPDSTTMEDGTIHNQLTLFNF